MLGLLSPTNPAWVESAQSDLPALLSDHAHCELKAAQSALSLVARYGGEAPELVEPLSALARDETGHFLQVQQRLQQIGGVLERPGSDRYVADLRVAARHNRHDGHPALLDRLLVAALVEGRSCERFRLLSEQLRDRGLRGFYRELMAEEAKHFTLFTSLASSVFGIGDTRARFATLAQRESAVVARLPLGPTVHG